MRQKKNILLAVAGFVILIVFGAWVVQYNSVHARVARASDRAYQDLLRKDYAAAVPELREELRLRPEDRDIRLTLGVTLARAGQQPEALTILTQLAQQNDKAGLSAQKVLAKIAKDPHWGMNNTQVQ